MPRFSETFFSATQSVGLGPDIEASASVIEVLVPVLLVRLIGCWIMVLLMTNLNLGAAWLVVVLVVSMGSVVVGLEDSETTALRNWFCVTGQKRVVSNRSW